MCPVDFGLGSRVPGKGGPVWRSIVARGELDLEAVRLSVCGGIGVWGNELEIKNG